MTYPMSCTKVFSDTQMNEYTPQQLEVSSIKKAEIIRACKKDGDMKAPDPKGVLDVAHKATLRSRHETFL